MERRPTTEDAVRRLGLVLRLRGRPSFSLGGGPAAQHRGVYTYSARAVDVFGGRGSFIPIDSFGQRVKIELSAMSPGLKDQINSRLRCRLPPILLTESHMIELLDHLWKRTACAVSRVREVGLTDFIPTDVRSVCVTRAKSTQQKRRCT